jgi:hypothetical protein
LTQLGFGLAALLLTAGNAWAGGGQVTVPEPASMALLATGVGALAVYRLRRRK